MVSMWLFKALNFKRKVVKMPESATMKEDTVTTCKGFRQPQRDTVFPPTDPIHNTIEDVSSEIPSTHGL